MHIKGLTCRSTGLRTKYARCQTPVCPQHRPPRPQHPVFSVFHRGGLVLGAAPPQAASSSPPIGGMTPSKPATRRRHAGSQLLMLQNPHRRRWGGCRGTAKYGGGAGGRWRGRGSVGPETVPGRIAGTGTVAEPGPVAVAGRQARQNSPSTPSPPLTPRKTRPAHHETPILVHFSCAGQTISRSQPRSGRDGRTFSRTGRSEVVAVKPTTPLQSLIRANVKPPSPLQPKNTPKPADSHPQRRRRFQAQARTSEQRPRRFQSHTGTHKHRRHRFHAKDLQHPHVASSPIQEKSHVIRSDRPHNNTQKR